MAYAAGPAAVERPTPLTPRERRWQWLASLIVLSVLGAGVITWFVQAGTPPVKPPVVEGLEETPEFAWRLGLAGDELWVPAGDGLVVYPRASSGGQPVEVRMLDAASGDERWAVPLDDEHAPRRIFVRDLPGTDHVAVMLNDSDGTQTQVHLLDRASGEVAEASLQLEPGQSLASTDAGSLLLLASEQGETSTGTVSVSLLGSPDVSDVVWSTDVSLPSAESLVINELDGWLAFSAPEPGVWVPGFIAFVGKKDGTVPEWWEPGQGQRRVVVDKLAVGSEGQDLVARDVATGEVAWTREECDCLPWEVGGELYARSSADEGQVLTHIDTGGESLWEAELGDVDVRDLRVLDNDDLVLITGDSADVSQLACLTRLDNKTGEAGDKHCHPVGGWYRWQGGDQIIWWDGTTLAAAGVDDDGLRWEKKFGEDAEIEVVDVDGHLLVHDLTAGQLGALE